MQKMGGNRKPRHAAKRGSDYSYSLGETEDASLLFHVRQLSATRGVQSHAPTAAVGWLAHGGEACYALHLFAGKRRQHPD